MQRTARLLAPHGAALATLALFLLVGLAVLDDYGVSTDEGIQRIIAEHYVDYVLRADADALESGRISRSDVFYGVAFEAPLLLAERALGLHDSRAAYISRHLITHLFFLTGGLFAYLLAHRLFGSRLLAVAAMLLFLLSPRLYAHSFFNSKDIPFLVMFTVTLFLAHRAFRRDALWSFALLGLGAGLLVNLRIMGVVLFAAIPAIRTLDLLLASEWEERRQALLTASVFALAGALGVYATTPFLWADPLERSVEWWTTSANHPTILRQLLGGDFIISSEAPARYLPVWFSITNAPAVLLLGGVGALAICAAGAARPRSLLRNTRLRFLCLIVTCFVASALAVVLLKPNIYNGWRQMYFLHAPFALLAAFGLHWAASAFRRRRLRATVYGTAALAAAGTVMSMILIHPYQHVYFNFLVDRTTPERLRTQYDMNHWGAAGLDGLRFLLRDEPAGIIAISDGPMRKNTQLLPDSDASRIIYSDELTGFHLESSLPAWRLGMAVSPSHVPLRHTRKIYGSTLYWVATFRLDDESATPYRELQDRLASSVPAVRSFFDIYVDGNSLVYTKEPCAAMDIRQSLFLHVYPKSGADGLPSGARAFGFLNLDFHPWHAGAWFDGQCIAVVPLPDYPIAYVSTGQAKGERLWEERIPIHNDGAFDDRSWLDSVGSSSTPAAQSVYDIHIIDDDLVYVKEPCVESDIASKFFLHVSPDRVGDLPADRREDGYDNLDFDFLLHGAPIDGLCAARVPLPEYSVASVRTGQFNESGVLWSAAFRLNAESSRAAYEAAVSREPDGQSTFDLYVNEADQTLTYVKEPCAASDLEPLFFLHIRPERASDLLERRRAVGFDNLDFDFRLRGAVFDGKCAALVSLPEYPIANLRTGQWVSGEGETWAVTVRPSPSRASQR